MPLIVTCNNNDDLVMRYAWPLRYTAFNPQIAETLREWRKQAIKDRDEILRYKKEFAKERDFARFFKQEAAYYLKLQRACTLMIPYFGEADRGQHVEPSSMWPIDIVSELDEISGRLVLRYG